MRKKELALAWIERLEREYPQAICSLSYDSAWQLMVAVRLSAQCTDARVNIVTEDLFKKYPTMESIAGADLDELTEAVKPCGLGPSKARDIKKLMNVLIDEYDKQIPDTMEELLRLPGVGRKSANLIGAQRTLLHDRVRVAVGEVHDSAFRDIRAHV